MSVELRFESSAANDYVGVLEESALVAGRIATQNAGSTNPGIYYQVGGDGLNGVFAGALRSELDTVNGALVAAYDARFGAGAWQADSAAGRSDRLTSLYVPLSSGRVAGMVYSVGPQLAGKIVDRDGYRQIYIDALEASASLDALRITMLSTGIYGGTSTAAEATTLARDVAVLILEAIDKANRKPGTILINTRGTDSASSKEIDAFTYAAQQRGIGLSGAGFTLA